MTSNLSPSQTEPSESADGKVISQRLPYESPRLVSLGSFGDLTKGGGLTGADQTEPWGNRMG